MPIVSRESRVPRSTAVLTIALTGAVIAVAGIAVAILALAGFLWVDGWPVSVALTALPVILVALGAVLLILAGNNARSLALAYLFPDAHLVMVASLPSSGAQIRELKKAFGVATNFTLLNYNMTLVVDTRVIQFYRGGRSPRLLLEISFSSLVDIGASRLTPAGAPAVERAEFVFQSPQGPIKQVLALASTGLIPRVLRNQELADELRAFGLAAGRSVPLSEER